VNFSDTLKPQININGTSAKELVQLRLDAYEALRVAANALAAMSPHGRDYITAPAHQYKIDRAAHRNRIMALENLRAALADEALDIQSQEDAMLQFDDLTAMLNDPQGGL